MTTSVYRNNDKSPLIMKFGGSTIGNLTYEGLVKKVLVLKESYKAEKVICVLSAQEGETQTLMDMAETLGPGLIGPPRDALVSNGENISVAAAWLAAENAQVKSRGVTAWQIGLRTSHSIGGKAYIQKIDTEYIYRILKDVDVLFVSGYQGVSPDNHIVTLCRGGSDVTAVAIAAALGVKECLICTDKEGIYQIDPRFGFKLTTILESMSYNQAIELGWLGMKIIHPRATIIAKRYKVELRIMYGGKEELNTTGTMIHNSILKEKPVIAMSNNEALFELQKYNDSPGILAKIYGLLCNYGLDLDLFYQGPEDIFFAVNIDDTTGKELSDAIKEIKKLELCKNVKKTLALTKVSVVTGELSKFPGITHEIIRRFASNQIDFLLLGGPRNRISTLTQEASANDTFKQMYEMFIESPII
ncbi:MAG: amino acid kinase family protein [Thermoleophilia bacterium]